MDFTWEEVFVFDPPLNGIPVLAGILASIGHVKSTS
jgi:hypothetical protein